MLNTLVIIFRHGPALQSALSPCDRNGCAANAPTYHESPHKSPGRASPGRG